MSPTLFMRSLKATFSGLRLLSTAKWDEKAVLQSACVSKMTAQFVSFIYKIPSISTLNIGNGFLRMKEEKEYSPWGRFKPHLSFPSCIWPWNVTEIIFVKHSNESTVQAVWPQLYIGHTPCQKKVMVVVGNQNDYTPGVKSKVFLKHLHTSEFSQYLICTSTPKSQMKYL